MEKNGNVQAAANLRGDIDRRNMYNGSRFERKEKKSIKI